jgi:phospholipid transport system substrate-binding protein
MVYYVTSTAPRFLRIRWLVLVIGLVVASMVAGGQAENQVPIASETAAANVAAFHAVLAAVAKESDQAAREAQLTPIIAEAFDLRRISAISLGRTWRTLSAAQQDAFVELLTVLVVATFADRFDSDTGLQFVTDKVVAVKSGAVVHTRLIRENGDDVSLNYFARNGRVFNVVADGVSDLSLRRADYNSIIKTEGYAALLAHIEAKIDLARSGQ